MKILKKIFNYLAIHGFFKWVPDKLYIQLMYYVRMDKILNLKNPITFTEKLQWLKLYDRNPKYTKMVDKYEAKKYVAEKIGDEYIIPTLGVWDKFDDIDFDSLPNQFVLKCTHDSGGSFICKNKVDFNKKLAKKKLNKSMRKNYYYNGREWPYKNVKPRIIAETLIEDKKSKHGLNDYKIFTFDGKAKMLYITNDRFFKSGTCMDFYDIDGNRIPCRWGYKTSDYDFVKPKNYDLMIHLAEKLGEGISHLRVDFYNIDGKIYFGEMTLFTWGGTMPIKPEKYDYIFGNWLNLPEKKENKYE